MNEPSKTCPQCGADVPEDSASTLCAKCLLQVGFETQDGPKDDSSAYSPTFIAPTVAELAPHFPQLDILEQIGHGGMGVVYKARQKELDRIVALKIIRPGISEDRSFEERFQREAKALAKLNHANIITVYDFGRKDGLFFFIMEFVDGTNLRHLERNGELSPQEALTIVPQICGALQYAHDNGVVHRDIKPENILISKEGEVRIADFGLAKLAGVADNAPVTGTWQVMGTPHYMAPEQFEKPTTVDHRADIYSLGVVIYELLTGELPLGRFPLPSSKARVDIRLDEVVLRALDKEPDRRYQRVTDVATAVEDASTVPLTADRPPFQIEFREVMCAFAVSARKVGKAVIGDSTIWKERCRKTVASLAERRTGIGRALKWTGGINAIGIVLSPQPYPMRDDNIAIALIAFAAGCLAFLFGRQLQHNRITAPIRWSALFCLLPGFAFFFLTDALQVLLTASGLIGLLHDVPQDNSTETPSVDFVDKLSDLFKTIQRNTTPQRLWLTVAGLAGWCGVCLATMFAVNELWFYHNVPSSYTVVDSSGREVRPRHGPDYLIQISADGRGASKGMSYEQLEAERNQIELTATKSGESIATLEIDFETHDAKIMAFGDKSYVRRQVGRAAVEEWIAHVVDDVSAAETQKQITNLTDIIGVMSSTRGIMRRISNNIIKWYPTAGQETARLRANEGRMQFGVIPVGQLLDSDLFDVAYRETGLRKSVRVNDRFASTSVFLGLAVFITGLIRVVRILFIHLWHPASMAKAPTEDMTGAAIQTWRRCCFGLIASSLCGATVFAKLFSNARLSDYHRPSFLTNPEMTFPGTNYEWILLALTAACIVVAIGALLARPWLRNPGRRFGQFSAGLAMIALPINLLSFPNGLAAWVLLGRSDVRTCFDRSTISPEANTTNAGS